MELLQYGRVDIPVGLLIREKTAIENPFMFSPEASFEFGFVTWKK